MWAAPWPGCGLGRRGWGRLGDIHENQVSEKCLESDALRITWVLGRRTWRLQSLLHPWRRPAFGHGGGFSSVDFCARSAEGVRT